MKIKNPILLRYPWLFPIFTTIGGGFVFVNSSGLSFQTQTIIFLAVVVVLNGLFFISLRRTLRDGNPKS